MTKKNLHIGSTFESRLDEAGIRDEVTVAAIVSLTRAQKKSGRPIRRPPRTN
jgi:antitoxin HicB